MSLGFSHLLLSMCFCAILICHGIYNFKSGQSNLWPENFWRKSFIVGGVSTYLPHSHAFIHLPKLTINNLRTITRGPIKLHIELSIYKVNVRSEHLSMWNWNVWGGREGPKEVQENCTFDSLSNLLTLLHSYYAIFTRK